MFDNLIVSNPEKQGVGGRLSASTVSMIVHGVVISFAIAATMKATEVVQEVVADTTMVFITEEEEPEQEEEKPPPPEIVTLNPPPKGFQTLAAPIDIPTEIPPIDLNERFDPRDYSGEGVEGGLFEGVEGGTGPVDLAQVFAEAVVDEVPERISSPPLEYPRMMRQAGIEGNVVLQAVVDTTGRVEPGSVRVVSSTHKSFESSARSLLEKSLFRPGRVRGTPVRVLIQIPVTFNLQGR